MDAGDTARRVTEAMKSRDFELMRAQLADDVVLNSPITAAFEFRGADEIVELLRTVRDAYETLEYTDVFGSGDVWAQVFRVRVRGQEMEATDVMRLDENGKVREFTVFFRPLAGLAALAAALAPGVAPTRSRALAARILTRPLELMTRSGDRVVTRLAGRR